MSRSDGQADDWRRLAALAGMLGSDHEGERANAARLTTIWLRRLGYTWGEFIGKASQALMGAAPRVDPVQDGWERPERRSYTPGKRTSARDGIRLWDFVRHASRQRQHLSTWDVNFLETFLAIGPRCSATEAQWAQIKRIADKLAMAA